MALRVAGHELVAWLDGGELRVAPEACPHMGARLSEGRVCEGALTCPWHGLRLDASGRGAWRPWPSFDDGVLCWVRLPELGQEPSARPYLPPRPSPFVDAVIELEARCEARDVIANRLDPWHGVHLHPRGFAALAMTAQELPGEEDRMHMRVAKRILGPLCIEVDITFHCADARTIVMTIVEGEGKGSVVETHATPIDGSEDEAGPRCRIVEATLAGSERKGFVHATRLAALMRPFMRRAALGLWRDDLPYAERLYALRQGTKRAASLHLPLRCD